jgi:hypothetical protein
MSRTSKARGEAYDNIAVASAISTRERTLPGDLNPAAGALPPAFTTWGNTENIAVGTDYSADENIVVVATNLLLRERLG